MGYVLDDGWDNCTPVARAGNAAFGVYVRCGIWVARNLTDGFIPGEIATAYGSPELTRKLLSVGLWEAVEGGYLAVDYLTLNATAQTVSKRREAEAERKRRYRERLANEAKSRRKAGKRGPGGTVRGTPASRPASKDAGVTGSLSFSSKEEKGGRSPASRGDASVPDAARASPLEEDPKPVDWRKQKAFGVEPDPEIAEVAQRGAAAARAQIKKPKAKRAPDERHSLAALDAAVAELSTPEATDAHEETQPPPVHDD